MNRFAELLDRYAELSRHLGSKQTFFYEFFKGNYDTLDAYIFEKDIKGMQEEIKVTRDMINEQLESNNK